MRPARERPAPFLLGGRRVPTYDYQCDDCGRTYEVRQRISAAPLTACQFCGGHIHRLLSATPFILKGGGWYVSDYPSESRKKAMEAEKKSAEPAGSAKGSPNSSANNSAKSSAKSSDSPSSSTSTAEASSGSSSGST